ncbi:hypothetical protein P0Y43_26850 [Pseudomonas entomophila]|uniref:hypothetical protein n=1 Tax=Pseudomonas entomophila TaxID=312306 RepID=UPI0023D848B6|nr:hypothetical protein [Pseudomonas entomophila]MDF0734310.1 hypothetical protein [Pseudomonas entomophila]
MNSLDRLIEVLPTSQRPEQSTVSPELGQANYQLQCVLAACAEPIACLNQLAVALDVAAQSDDQWLQALPSEFRNRSQAIAQGLEHWRQAVASASAQQADDYADLLDLGSQPSRYPRQLLEQRRNALLQRLFDRFGQGVPSATLLAPWRTLLSGRQGAWKRVQEILLGEQAGWRASVARLREATLDAMRAEAGLQAEEGLLAVGHAQRLLAPEAAPSRLWLAAQVGEQTLPGVWVLTERQAWSSGRRDIPLLLWVQGEGGGMACLDDRQRLSDRLAFTLREGGLPAALALPDEDRELQWLPAEEGLEGLWDAMLSYWQGDSADETAEARERHLMLARAALAIPGDTCRQAALALAERQWQADALIEHMPTWILSRSDAERIAYAHMLRDYHAAALALECHLRAEVPLFPVWAGRLLKARIFEDLAIEVGIDEILLWRPDHSLDFSLPYLPSTVSEVACESFDPRNDDEYTRLDRARWHVQGIDHDYLAQVLPDLDPLRRYEEKLRKEFDPGQAGDPERLRQPFLLELKLLATTERWRAHLSEQGARMLEQAAEAPSRQALEEAGLRLHWVLVHSTQELGQTVEGAAALVNDDGHALIYLPGAMASVRLIERESLEEAVAYLASCIRSMPQLALYIAQRCSDEPSVLLGYLHQAALRNYTGYLRTVPCLDQTLVGLQLAGRCNLMVAQAREEGRSQAGIRKSNVHASHLRHVGYLWLALGVIPGLGTWQSVMAIHDGALEVAESWRTGDSIQMIRGTLSVAMGVIDIFLTALPVGASLSTLRRVVRQVVQQRAARQPWRGYASGQLLDGAEPLGGMDANTWRQHGRQYIWQDGLAYEVYRRSDEATLRLRATAARLYEAPVRQEGARWVMHAEVGLRGGGGKLTEAERLFADWGPRSQHPPLRNTTRVQALARGRRELARYDLRDNQQQVEFAYSFLQDGVAPGWSTQYLREGAHLRPVPVGDSWQAVRWNLSQGDGISTLSDGRVYVTFAGARQVRLPGVRLDGHYYPILEGMQPRNVAYVRPNAAMPGTLAELDALIERGAGPVRIALGDTPVDTPRVLGGFTETFQQRLAARFPSLSQSSRRALGETLYRRADTAGQSLTDTRLIRLQERLADPHLEPLQEMTAIAVHAHVRHLAIEAQDGPLRQLCWYLQPHEHRALRDAMGSLDPEPLTSALRSVVTARGYQVLEAAGTGQSQLMVLRRRGLPEVYVLVQAHTLGQVSLQDANGMLLLSDPWLDTLIATVTDLRLAALLRNARRQGVLHPILGGVQLEGQRRGLLLWERVNIAAGDHAPLPNLRNWRHELRPLGASDIELGAGTGLYGVQGQASVRGALVSRQFLPVFPAEPGSQVLLSRSSSLSSALSFDDLERCLRERFNEQPWLVARDSGGWAVRRPLFTAPLDSQVSGARTGLTRQSALNAARHVFERAQGSDHERLLYLENVSGGWAYGSRPVDELADPLLLLREQTPAGLDSGAAWRLPLMVDEATATPSLYYLRAAGSHSQNLLAAVSGARMRHLALNLVDDMLVQYGLTQRHRAGSVVLYHQAASERSYLVAMATSEQAGVEFALQEGRALLSDAWLQHWRQQLPTEAEQLLQQSQARGRLVRLVAVLRLEQGPHAGEVAVLRLAYF